MEERGRPAAVLMDKPRQLSCRGRVQKIVVCTILRDQASLLLSDDQDG